MFGILDWVKIGGGVLIGALVAGTVGYNIGFYRGNNYGYTRYKAEQAVRDVQAERERKRDDATLQGLSDYDACVAGLRRRGLPIDACEQLRGLHAE